MAHETGWKELAEELGKIRTVEPLRADWHAFEGSERYGIWLFRPGGSETDEARATFSLIAARAIESLGIPPIPTPQPLQHFPDWELYCEVGREASDAIPYGLGLVDFDAVDPCSRAWLELLRRVSPSFRTKGNGTLTIKGRRYSTLTGTIGDLCEASAVFCTRLDRNEIGAQTILRSGAAARTASGNRDDKPDEAGSTTAGRSALSEEEMASVPVSPESSQPPLKDIDDDEERRNSARRNLKRTLQNYLERLPREKLLDLQELAKFWSAYAVALYDSVAECHMAGPPVNPEVLFGDSGVLAGGQTMAELRIDLQTISVQRPLHWPIPEIYRPGDPPELRAALHELKGNQPYLFSWLLDEPGFWDGLRKRVAEGVPEWRQQFQKRFSDHVELASRVLPFSTAAEAGQPVEKASVTKGDSIGESAADASPRSEASEPAATEPHGEARLSARDQRIHDSLGEHSFRNLTNTDILRDRHLRKVLRDHELELGTDAAKASLDRIRRGRGYPLSRAISKKRSNRP